MSDVILPGQDLPIPKTTLYKVTQKFPNGAVSCKVFQPEGLNTAMADLLANLNNGTKNVEISTLQLNTKSVNLEDFFKTGGMLYATADIK